MKFQIADCRLNCKPICNLQSAIILDQFPNGCTGPLALDLQSSAGMADCKSAMSKGGLYIQSEFDLMDSSSSQPHVQTREM
jgi:hypothetical protein